MNVPGFESLRDTLTVNHGKRRKFDEGPGGDDGGMAWDAFSASPTSHQQSPASMFHHQMPQQQASQPYPRISNLVRDAVVKMSHITLSNLDSLCSVSIAINFPLSLPSLIKSSFVANMHLLTFQHSL
jgi:hypothetical protein